MIEMFDDRVEISNPEDFCLLLLKILGHKSMTRNPLIFGLFTVCTWLKELHPVFLVCRKP